MTIDEALQKIKLRLHIDINNTNDDAILTELIYSSAHWCLNYLDYKNPPDIFTMFDDFVFMQAVSILVSDNYDYSQTPNNNGSKISEAVLWQLNIIKGLY